MARLAKTPRAARQVGYALAALKGGAQGVPWHRVLGLASPGLGRITLPDGARQKKKLLAEGVRFDARGRVALADYGWPRQAASAAQRSLRS